MAANSATARIQPKKQTLDDAYAPPANFLEIDLVNPETHGIGNKRYTDYELKMRVSVLRGSSASRADTKEVTIACILLMGSVSISGH